MRKKICNQSGVKGKHKAGCFTCGEMIDMPPLPCDVRSMVKFMRAFVDLHTAKGCNKAHVAPPEWAASEMNVTIA